MVVNELRCKRCDTVRSISEFDRGFFGKQGFDVFCHDCRVEIDKIYNSVVEIDITLSTHLISSFLMMKHDKQ